MYLRSSLTSLSFNFDSCLYCITGNLVKCVGIRTKKTTLGQSTLFARNYGSRIRQRHSGTDYILPWYSNVVCGISRTCFVLFIYSHVVYRPRGNVKGSAQHNVIINFTSD